jgi:hypothetical protein
MPELTRKQIILGAALAILLIVAVVEYLYLYGPLGNREPSAEELTQTAMQAPEVNEREKAVRQLGAKGRVAVPQLRQVLRDAREPEVKAAAIRSLGDNYDYDSVPAMLEGLEDPSPLVRARSHASLIKVLGTKAVDYDVHAPPARQRKFVQFYRDQWNALKNSPAALKAQKEKVERIKGPVGGG